MFTEANTAQAYVRDLLAGPPPARTIGEERLPYGRDSIAVAGAGLGWRYVAPGQVPRAAGEVMVETWLRDALIRLNPSLAAQPDRADDVIYRLRSILLTVNADGLVRANEEFTAWLRGERTMPFGPNNEHVTIRLIDFDHPRQNDLVVTTEWTYRQGGLEKRFDLVLVVNGLPLVIGEAKTPVRPAASWVDGAHDIHDDYERNVPAMFVPNVFSFATEGKEFRFGSIRMPLELWAPWREADAAVAAASALSEIETAVRGLLRPETVLDILRFFTLFATDKRHQKIKLIARFQQYHAANQIVARVVAGRVKKGLIWHFQGSGKSLLMVFAAQKLRLDPALRNPTVLIVVDRLDLDTQITATFNAADVPNMVTAGTREELHRLLSQDARKVIITTIYRFAEAPGVLNQRDNIIVMVDEAHRTQEGDLGRQMRQALPNAFLFGLTGTPINQKDRNTFWAFGAEEDAGGYLSRYSFEESIRDKATLPLHFTARLIEHRINRAAIDEAFAQITGDLNEVDQANLSRRAARLGVLMKAPSHVDAVAADIARHFGESVAPNGFKAQVVTFDRAACVLYKAALDRHLPPAASAIVMTVGKGEDAWREYDRSADDERKLLDRFRDPADPLQILIVTSKLLTGFDAPILQAMYLDKPIKAHNLLQAICRVNRPYPGKTHGLIIDYLGIFDDVAQALDFDEQSVQQVISNLDELKSQLGPALAACLAYFPNVDRTTLGYEGLIAAQECLRSNEARDAFAQSFSIVNQLWEALSPDPVIHPYRDDYRWLSQVYESVKPPSGHGKLLWHALGAKTIDLINEHVHVEAVRDDLETLILNPDVLAGMIQADDAGAAKILEIKIAARLRRHANDPVFVALGERLEEVRQRHELGLLTSIAYIKGLLPIATDTVAAEKRVDSISETDRAKAALTELFLETRNDQTPIIVERIITEIDEIVRHVRFEGWQNTTSGEREVKQALSKTLQKYKLRQDQELFDRAYQYIEQYY